MRAECVQELEVLRTQLVIPAAETQNSDAETLKLQVAELEDQLNHQAET